MQCRKPLLKKEVLSANEIEELLGPRPFPKADDHHEDESVAIKSNGTDDSDASDAAAAEVDRADSGDGADKPEATSSSSEPDVKTEPAQG